MVGVMSSMRLTLLVFYGFFSPLVESQSVPVQEVSTNAAPNENQESEISPFLVLGVGETLYSLPYTWPEAPDQGNIVEMHRSGQGLYHYITTISFHYRRRLIFWGTTDGKVRTGSFVNRTKLNDIKDIQVINGPPYNHLFIGDLAVDWISDKLYWAVRKEGKIEELDLETEQRRVVVQSAPKTAVFSGLAIYPYPNNGWIYWSDREAGTIERVALTGEGRQAQLVRDNLGKCTWPLEIDYSMQTLYWVNTCQNNLQSLQITDSELSVDTVAIQSSFSGTVSMTLFENVIYWNEDMTVRATNKSIELGEIVQIYRGSASLPYPVVMELVHPGKQPQEEEFIKIINMNVDVEMLNKTCPPCINGHCIPPGVCACDNGWTGDNCTTDINECDLARNECDYECHNTLGSFYCSCNSSSYLDSDGRTCVLGLLTTTYMIDPTVSTSAGMGIGPKETSPGDHEFTATSLLTNAGPIHSRTIMASDTLLPLLSSHFAVMLPSSSVATANTAGGTPISEIYSTSQPPFLPESHTTSISEPTFLPKSTTSTPADSSFLPKSTADSTFLPNSISTKSEPSLFPKSTSLVNPHSSSKLSSSIHGVAASPTVTSGLLTKLPKSTSSSFTDELYKSTSTYRIIDNSISVTVSEQAGIAPSTTTVGLTSSFSTAVPSSTSPMASLVATASPTPTPSSRRSGLSTSSVVILSSPVLPTSTTFAIQSSFTLSSMVFVPLETPTTASEMTQSDADSSTDPATEPLSNGMTLIVIAAASAGACVILIIVVVIMIAAVVHYANKRCGSYTVNPDPEKKSNGTPSWISVVQASPSAPATNHANGHSNGHSYRTKSFRASSPTCSTHSFT